MRVDIELEDYSKEKGIQLKWEEGYNIKVETKNDEVLITANKAGLISLANQFLTLSQDGVERGTHIHLDAYNSLEDGSVDLIIEKDNA